MVAIFILLAVAFRYVSLGSIAVAAAFPLLAWALGEYHEPTELFIIAIVSTLVIWKHRQNINRLTHGTESRIGSKRGETEIEQTKMDQASAGHSGERG
jgi:acyl phosphate:glycerol-3-phosphate acyltransferase